MDSLKSGAPVTGEPPRTLAGLLAYVRREIAELPQILNDREKAGIILEIACDGHPRDLLMEPHKLIPAMAAERVEEVLARLREGMPIAYALGECFFAGRRFLVDQSVLIPRPDTEALLMATAEAARQRVTDTCAPLRVLELGTGSGAVIISLAADFSNLEAVATDISRDALVVARRNAHRHRVRLDLREGDLFASLQAGPAFDLILANPPYVGSESELDPSVLQWEPTEALLVPAGEPATYYHHLIARKAGRFLAAGGWLGLEVGEGQAREVASILENSGYNSVRIRRDLTAIERVVIGSWHG